MKRAMFNEAIRVDDLYPDGIRISISWDTWEVGMSTFVPCIATKRAIKQAQEIAFRKDIVMMHDVVIEDCVFGVRFWRIS